MFRKKAENVKVANWLDNSDRRGGKRRHGDSVTSNEEEGG
jgi:hypothetical protein